jgi:hypothetical protein
LWYQEGKNGDKQLKALPGFDLEPEAAVLLTHCTFIMR